jgi:hypothetical protein
MARTAQTIRSRCRCIVVAVAARCTSPHDLRVLEEHAEIGDLRRHREPAPPGETRRHDQELGSAFGVAALFHVDSHPIDDRFGTVGGPTRLLRREESDVNGASGGLMRIVSL